MPQSNSTLIRHPGVAVLGLAVAALLASCHNEDCNDCAFASPSEYSNGVVAADINGDGVPDVVALSSIEPPSATGSNLKTFLATSPGAFAAPVLTADGVNPLFIVSADLNGDGLLDVVTASYDDGALSVFFNTKATPGTFGSPLVLNSPGASQVAVADMTGDGMPDIVSADYNVSLFVQSAPGTFAAAVPLYSGGANWVALGDLNDDAAPDIALTDAVGVKVLMHTGAPASTTYAPAVNVFTQTVNQDVAGANIIAIGDVNGDGLNDLVITDPGPTGGASPTVNVLLQNPLNHGSFLAPLSFPIAAQDLPVSIVLADLEGSGKLDIVIGGSSTVAVLLHDPANPGRFLPVTVYQATWANEIAVADVNGDGKPDIVVSTGVSHPVMGGVITTNPGVLLQSATTPGSFGALQDLP